MSWRDAAACRDLPTAAFFPEVGQTIDPEVRRTCAACPVYAECDTWADTNGELGVWAGLSESQRRERRRAAGRKPSKPPQAELMRELDESLAPPQDPRTVYHREWRRARRAELARSAEESTR